MSKRGYTQLTNWSPKSEMLPCQWGNIPYEKWCYKERNRRRDKCKVLRRTRHDRDRDEDVVECCLAKWEGLGK